MINTGWLKTAVSLKWIQSNPIQFDSNWVISLLFIYIKQVFYIGVLSVQGIHVGYMAQPR